MCYHTILLTGEIRDINDIANQIVTGILALPLRGTKNLCFVPWEQCVDHLQFVLIPQPSLDRQDPIDLEHQQYMLKHGWLPTEITHATMSSSPADKQQHS